ncbi:molecular chaperone HtpG [Thiohalospira sp.]|uniref:molecular chaperone HtpG n=1 Tax=Thiohalospira sp. TaxID=3080549 RepID=UPI00397FD09A
MAGEQQETHSFQAEVSQLLHLMIHSLYSSKEIFLRELISNGADAADKLRFEAIADEALWEGDEELRIEVDYDPEARTVSVTDNGIGMSRDDVVENIGTIARSGTRAFVDQLTGDQARDAELIGQFGVGFYSAFIVADRVTVESRRAGMGAEHGVRWESDGEGEYTLETIERPERGTRITLHLREGEDEFLEGMRLRHIIRTWSDHIGLPIRMPKQGEEGPDRSEWETVNQASALWTRPRNEIGEEEYKGFYKHVAHDFEDPLTWIHARVEGKLEYTLLLYIPQRAPFDLWEREQRHGLKLYVRRVFILEDSQQLLPHYLRFVRGVVDSADLPLNVSREILQSSKITESIRAGAVKRVLDRLESMAKDEPENYAAFWGQFGAVMKEGPGEDFANQERLAGLLRFASTRGEGAEQTVSLDDYIERMHEGQKAIYYITAESHAAAAASPHLEVFRKKDVEVLLLSDRVDEWLMANLTRYKEIPFASVTKGDVDLSDLGEEGTDEEQEKEEAQQRLGDLGERVEKVLGERVKGVRASHRLTDSPACLVADENALSTNLERMLRAAGQEVPHTPPWLELNPDHPLVKRLEAEPEGQRFEDWTHVLFDQAVLAEGGQLEEPAGFVGRLNALLLEIQDGGDRQ